MTWRRRRLGAVAAITTALFGALVAPAALGPAEAAPPGKGKPVTVMTRNLYLGADIQRPIRAAFGKTGFEAVLALANATHLTRAIVDDTDFGVRSRLLADEIARTRPDLIGLQEVALWRRGPLELDKVGEPNATDVDYDYLQMLLDALADEGMEYEPISVQEESDVESPSFVGTNPFSPTADASDVRLTMHDVILMRVDDGLKVLDSGGGNYAHTLDVTIADKTMSFVRGYNWADIRAGSKTFRFLNTHLEAFSSDLAYAQAAELLAGPAAYDGTTILVCDCNSDPLNHHVKTDIGDTLPHSAPYDLITSRFTDEWLEFKPAAEGWTSGLSETVDDPDASGFDHRIDMVFARRADGSALAVDRGTVTGNSVDDRDPATGLWPSDHAGVVLRLR
jgi:endonuclease/exonuclease/phosphatase family metal-dependent hydrolase